MKKGKVLGKCNSYNLGDNKVLAVDWETGTIYLLETKVTKIMEGKATENIVATLNKYLWD